VREREEGERERDKEKAVLFLSSVHLNPVTLL
jgi:hypothetical protein